MIVDTTPDLHQKGDFSPAKRMKGIFVYVVEIRLPLAKCKVTKIVNEYDQEIPQSQTADNPVAP